MATTPGYASCSYELRHSLMSRSAWITFGLDPTATDPSAIATSLASAFGAAGSLMSIIDSNVQLQSTRVALGTDGAEDIIGTSPQLVSCTLTQTGSTPNVAFLVHKRSARGGRRGRGRMYIPWARGLAAANEAGVIGSTDIAAVNTAVGNWATAVTAAQGPIVILHRASTPGTVNPTTPGAPNVVTSFVADPLVATQRRRLGR